MGLSLKPEHLRRYRDMAVLLLKYGRSDMVFNAGLGMDEPDPARPQPSRRRNLADDLEALGPTFVKVGSCSRPAPTCCRPKRCARSRACRTTSSRSPSKTSSGSSRRSSASASSKAFSRFDATPIAAASLGQVHRAALRDGREVAVKVQRPNIREQVLEGHGDDRGGRRVPRSATPRPGAASA